MSRHCLSDKLYVQRLECETKLHSLGERSTLSCKGGTSHWLAWNAVRIVTGIPFALCRGVLFCSVEGMGVVAKVIHTIWNAIRVAGGAGVPVVRRTAPGFGGTCRFLWNCFFSVAAQVGFVVGLAGMLVSLASVMLAVRTAARLGA